MLCIRSRSGVNTNIRHFCLLPVTLGIVLNHCAQLNICNTTEYFCYYNFFPSIFISLCTVAAETGFLFELKQIKI